MGETSLVLRSTAGLDQVFGGVAAIDLVSRSRHQLHSRIGVMGVFFRANFYLCRDNMV